MGDGVGEGWLVQIRVTAVRERPDGGLIEWAARETEQTHIHTHIHRLID